MKYLCIWLTLVFFSSAAFPEEVWVTVPSLTTQSRLNAIAESHRAQSHTADFVSSFEEQLRHPISSSTLTSLVSVESEAQSASLEGKFSRSMELYQHLLKTLEKIPNVAGVERITLAAFIRIAELDDLMKNANSARAWNQARAWIAGKLSPTSEFSPKTIIKLNSVKEPLSVRISVISPIESAVYIDGRRLHQISDNLKVSVIPGYHQLSVLVPGSEWMIKGINVKAGETRDVSFRPEPVVEGSCEKPHYIGSALPSKTRLLVSFKNCDRVYFEKTWFTISGNILESLSPESQEPSRYNEPSKSHGSSMSHESSETAHSAMMTELLATPEKKSLWGELSQSKWFWTGVGIVAFGAVALTIQNQNQPPTVIPTNSIR